MPELPEVETVRRTLKNLVLNEVILKADVFWDSIIEYPKVEEFKKRIQNQKILDFKRRGKWLIFVLEDDVLLSHLRMEGKFFLKKEEDTLSKHEHVVFYLKSGLQLRYHDTRKFGRMHLLKKEEMYSKKPLIDLGLEPWDLNLTSTYLKEKLKHKTIPIKTCLLDQSIMVGNGNIYADEVLFLSKIHPLKKSNNLTKKNLDDIILNTRKVLESAIEQGGTTIRSFEYKEGVHGRFQNELKVHGMKTCPICKGEILKITVGGRGTYYCPTCQKK